MYMSSLGLSVPSKTVGLFPDTDPEAFDMGEEDGAAMGEGVGVADIVVSKKRIN